MVARDGMMSPMRRILGAVLASGCWASAPPPAPIANTPQRPKSPPQPEHWVGIGRQYDDDSRWDIDLVIDPAARIGGRLGTINYPTIGCRAELTREPDRHGELIAVEHIVADPQQHCIDSGEISIPRERGMSFHWRWRDPESGEEGAEAELSRVIPESHQAPVHR